MTAIRRHAFVLTAALLLCGCSSLLGGPSEPITVYSPQVSASPDPAWPAVRWSLSIATPNVPEALDSQRIMVSPAPGELQAYSAGRWAQAPGAMVEASVLRLLEDSGKIAAVSRQGSGASTDYRLLLDLRDFRSDYAGAAVPSATIEVSAKLLRLSDQAIVGSHVFKVAQPASGVEIAQVADAFTQALGTLGTQMAGWTLETGQADARKPH